MIQYYCLILCESGESGEVHETLIIYACNRKSRLCKPARPKVNKFVTQVSSELPADTISPNGRSWCYWSQRINY